MKQRYSPLSKLTLAILSFFHGYQVESSSNTMNDVIDEQSGCTNIETFNAILTVQYLLRAKKKTSYQIFAIKNKLHDPINRLLCYNFRTASRKHFEHLKEERAEKDSRKRTLNVQVAS